MHQEELSNPHYTWVRLLAAQMGVGGDDSWSPSVAQEYLLTKGNYHYAVSFKLT